MCCSWEGNHRYRVTLVTDFSGLSNCVLKALWVEMSTPPTLLYGHGTLYLNFIFIIQLLPNVVPSVLWRCWLGSRKGIRPVKNWVVRCWRGYLSGARCRLAYAQLMPLPLTVSCFSKIQIGFTFLVSAHQGSPGKKAVKRVCVCVTKCLSWHLTKAQLFFIY